MTTATMAAPKSGATFGIDRLFLALALIATAILIALVLLDGQPASAALLLGGFGLGIAFLKAEFSYTASWRRFLTRGEAVIWLPARVISPYGSPRWHAPGRRFESACRPGCQVRSSRA